MVNYCPLARIIISNHIIKREKVEFQNNILLFKTFYKKFPWRENYLIKPKEEKIVKNKHFKFYKIQYFNSIFCTIQMCASVKTQQRS